MRFLLSTIGSRGEAQPTLALAVELQSRGHEAVVCAPPDFAAWAAELGVEYVPVGPELRPTARPPAAPTIPTPEQRQQMIDGTVATQFTAIEPVVGGCDAVVGGGALAIAAHSIAEANGIPYVYAAFAPITLPSAHHAPPAFGMLGQSHGDDDDPVALWHADRERWNAMWGAPLNRQRERLGLPAVDEVRDHLFTRTPWLAADPVLAPWPDSAELEVSQTGAWLLDDRRPLPADLEAFLAAGELPVYFGFGSVRVPAGTATAVLAAARGLGRRVVVSQGWAELSLDWSDPDCFAVGEVNQQALFPRTAAIVHHGGAGTTTAAALAAVPQVVVPQMFDQFYFATQVERLGIGTAVRGELTAEALTAQLVAALDQERAHRASEVASEMTRGGSANAARMIESLGAGLT